MSTDDQVSLEATLTFHLDRLLYHPDDLGLARERRVEADRSRELIETVTGIYFERRRLMLERDLQGRRDLETRVRIAELAALLNAFTGGRFGRMMAAQARQTDP